MTRLFLLLLLLAPAARAQAEDMARGEYLARAADCVACHSAPGGRAFAGGLKMGTPMGAIYASNITPDPETGIGAYSLADFEAAMRRGIAKDGHHLYPAMPYPSYARMSDADISALYDWFMHAVPPVKQANKPSEITGMVGARWQMAVWNTLFGGAAFKPDPGHDMAWNRGAYLVEGPGHCGACHTPRGVAFQEKAGDHTDADFLAGAELDGWYAPSLRGEKTVGLGQWSAADIVAFLKNGRNGHASAYGSMREVINNSTPYLTDADLAAIAVFLKSLPARGAEPAPAAAPPPAGAAVYAANCQFCHRADGGAAPPYLPPLAGNPTVQDADPVSLVNLVLNGADPLVVRGVPEPYRMPQFREQLSNQQIADVIGYIRGAWGNHAGPISPEGVGALRNRTDPSSDRVIVLKMR